MPRRIRDVAGSVLAVVALFAVLVAVDSRVRSRAGRAVTDVADVRWAESPAAVGRFVTGVARDLSVQNVFLVALLCAAVVLVVLMLRT